MTAKICRMRQGETLADFCAVMDRLTHVFRIHQDRVFASGNMDSIRANVRGQIGQQIAKVMATIETRETQ